VIDVGLPPASAGTARRVVFAALVLVFGLAALVPAFGLIDLIGPWFLHEGNQVSDVGYGALAGVVLGVGFLSQLRSPERRIAGVQQLAMAVPAYLAAGALGRDPDFFPFAVVLALAVGATVALHPARRRFLTPGTPRPLLGVLALAAVVPLLAYALGMARNQRADMLPVDSHGGLNQWAALTAAALAVLLIALLASLGTDGFAIPAWCAAGGVAAWSVASLVYPDYPGAEGRWWAALALFWATAFAVAAERSRRADDA
jgi:hypothetical protein